MIVELILQTGVAPGVCALLPLEHDRATVRHDQPGPHQQYPRLAERDLAVIDPDQASPLGDQTGAASWGVIDIFGDLRCEPSQLRRRRAASFGRPSQNSELEVSWSRRFEEPIPLPDEMAAKAAEDYYHDFLSPLDLPELELDASDSGRGASWSDFGNSSPAG